MRQTEELADSIVLTVNGSARDVPPGFTITDLLQSLRIDPRLVVVEHNREIVRDRTSYASRVLHDGDALEIVHFVGGG